MDPALPPALACLVGYFGYETVGLVEKLPRPAPNAIGLPDMLFVRPTVILVFDRLADALYIVAPVWKGSFTAADQAVDAALERIDATADELTAEKAKHKATADERDKLAVDCRELGDKLKKSDAAKSETEAKLAAAINERQQVVADYESGRAIPDSRILNKIIKVLGPLK